MVGSTGLTGSTGLLVVTGVEVLSGTAEEADAGLLSLSEGVLETSSEALATGVVDSCGVEVSSSLPLLTAMTIMRMITTNTMQSVMIRIPRFFLFGVFAEELFSSSICSTSL